MTAVICHEDLFKAFCEMARILSALQILISFMGNQTNSAWHEKSGRYYQLHIRRVVINLKK